MDFTKRPFLEHIEELMLRVRRSFLWILLGFALAYFFSNDVVLVLQNPILKLLPSGTHLVFTTPFEKFWVYMRISLIMGIVFVLPFLLFEIFSFVGPALRSLEKKRIFFLGSNFVLVFSFGVVLGYLYVLPLVMKAILDFGGGAELPFLTLSSYINTVLGILIATGLFLELPVLMIYLSSWGWVGVDFWKKGRRVAIVANALVSAILSPPDALSMILMMIPLHILYECGILGARVAQWFLDGKVKEKHAHSA